MKRTPLRRKVTSKGYDQDMAKAWWRAVCHPKAHCLVCGTPKGLQAHHVLDKEWLNRVLATAGDEVRNQMVWSVSNGVALCTGCHERHTNSYRRVPRYLLPAKCWEFARSMDLILGTEAATVRLELSYPDA